MKTLIQRINRAAVYADGEMTGSAEKGLLVLVGVFSEDTDAEATALAKRVAELRVFCDSADKMNLSLLDIGGEVLAVSNFTLCADTKKGNRPSYFAAMEPVEAKRLYELFCEELTLNGVRHVGRGKFGADMKIDTELNGPVTVMLDTEDRRKK